MKINGEETFFGKQINTSEEFIKDLCDRIDNVYKIIIEEENKTLQLNYISSF